MNAKEKLRSRYCENLEQLLAAPWDTLDFRQSIVNREMLSALDYTSPDSRRLGYQGVKCQVGADVCGGEDTNSSPKILSGVGQTLQNKSKPYIRNKTSLSTPLPLWYIREWRELVERHLTFNAHLDLRTSVL